jgi:hypothetical protein
MAIVSTMKKGRLGGRGGIDSYRFWSIVWGLDRKGAKYRA